MKQKPITTKQLIAKLLELDPEGNQEVCIETPIDEDCGGWLYENNIEIETYDKIIILYATGWRE